MIEIFIHSFPDVARYIRYTGGEVDLHQFFDGTEPGHQELQRDRFEEYLKGSRYREFVSLEPGSWIAHCIGRPALGSWVYWNPLLNDGGGE